MMANEGQPPLVLASASPRRRELLAALGVLFEVAAAGIDETSAERDPARLAEGLALRKARAVAEARPDAVVVGSDTIVVLDGAMLAKPADADEARAMLRSLRGSVHEVITGVAAVSGPRVAADHARTAVFMRDYEDMEIEAFVARGEPFDKAGGYAIQDVEFHPVERVEGCECSVIGLPLWTLRDVLRAVGVSTHAPSLDRCAGCPSGKGQT